MASSVFFRFRSQKEPTRVAFDGTGISVFDLKKEIIVLNKLGDGSDFELVLTTADSNEVYGDDTTIIPRSTTVLARRLPAARPGRGGAARYVSGKMPISAKNSLRSEAGIPRSLTHPHSTKAAVKNITISDLSTEEERMAAVLQMGADQWEQQQKEMANATPIHRGGPLKGKPISVPDHPPPPGYVCYRCGEKGHWIQVCPTNEDPTFDGRPRIKRTTGIPRSFLRVVERPTALASDGTTDDTKQPPGVMINADGNWVVAEPDKASWEQYRLKATVSAAAQEQASRGSKELQNRGLECPIDKRMFIEPTKTPCCHTIYCKECITNALLDDDLRCPGCGKDGILIDDLKPSDEMLAKIREYEEEKNQNLQTLPKAAQEQSEKPNLLAVKQENSIHEETKIKAYSTEGEQSAASTPGKSTYGDSKKRKADRELDNDRGSPAATGNTLSTKLIEKTSELSSSSQGEQFPPELAFLNQPPLPAGNFMPTFPFPYPNGYMGMPMESMMTSGMVNPMMLPGGTAIGGPFHQWNGTSPIFSPNTNGIWATNNPHGGYGQMNGQMQMGNGHPAMSNVWGRGRGAGNFANQQRTQFTAAGSNAEDSAYFRQPVNPHRQGRRNAPRPTDYREI